MRAPLRSASGLFCAALFVALTLPTAAFGQVSNGVIIDTDGVLRVRQFEEPGGQLHRQRVAAARAALDQNLQAKSKLRKVSLTRLEAAMADAIANNRQFSDAMFHLAGLTRVHYVFYYPETKDIVLAGPAEGWMTDGAGRTVGIDSGRPTLMLEDLVVALRACALGGRSSVISVSIDPTQEGLRRMHDFLMKIGATIRHGDEPMIVEGLQTNLGRQHVVIHGISPKTHFAQVLVEADYRMKLIGIGLENPGVAITSYVSRATPGSVARNALQRWYFIPNYDCVRVSDDGLAAELLGDGVKLVGENELVAADGSRHVSGQSDPASGAFTRSFTQRYGQLAVRAPVYAQMRDCIDLAVAAAEIRAAGWLDQALWQMPILGSEEKFPVETHTMPVQVDPAINAIMKGGHFMTPIGGGVLIQANLAVKSENVQHDANGQLQKAHANVQPPKSVPNQWWWD